MSRTSAQHVAGRTLTQSLGYRLNLRPEEIQIQL